MQNIRLDAGAAALLARLHGAGYAAYAVGGCVRDSLLGRTPQDWDLCTSARPEQVLALFGEGQCIPTGLQHGTVTIKYGGQLYETTTFRTEGAYTDGRHPDEVHFVPDVRQDLARRDFTINAMAYNDAEGLIDPFGGQQDLQQGILRAVGDSRRPLYFLLFSAGVNTGLDLLFVAKFQWGIAGAAIATILAQFLSAVLVLGVLTFTSSSCRIRWKGMRMQKGILRNMLVVGLPSGLQLAITSFSNVFVQSYVNRFASSCMAGWAAYQKIDAFAILPMMTLSVSATTFVGQNVGAGNWNRAQKGTRMALGMATAATVLILIPLMIWARPLCALFNQESQVLDFGVYFIRLISPFYLIANFNQIYAGALRGAGDAKMPMYIMLGSFVVFRQIYLLVTYQCFGTLLPVALGYPVGWVLCSVLLLGYYRSGKWKKRSLVGETS